MTTRDTHELEEAGQKLSLETLKESLRLNKGDPDSKKPVLLMRIGDRVIEIGIEGFLQHLEFSYLEQACKAVKIDTEEGKKSRTLLYEKIVEDGLNSFLCTCSFPLLKEFCRVLLLEEGTRDSMSQQITDEIMLTGTKKFFHNLTPVLLKKWCEQLNLKTTGTKKVLVERLMVDIFELEPLAATEEPEKKQAKKKDTTSNNKKQEKKQTEDKEKERREEEEIQKKEKDVSEEDSEDDEREGGRGRGKYVAPPLSTIKKGMTREDLHNLFNLTDLQKYCRQEGLSSTGKKPVLIKRIITYLEKGLKQEPGKKGAKRKSFKGGKRRRDQDRGRDKQDAGSDNDGKELQSEPKKIKVDEPENGNQEDTTHKEVDT